MGYLDRQAKKTDRARKQAARRAAGQAAWAALTPEQRRVRIIIGLVVIGACVILAIVSSATSNSQNGTGSASSASLSSDTHDQKTCVAFWQVQNDPTIDQQLNNPAWATFIYEGGVAEDPSLQADVKTLASDVTSYSDQSALSDEQAISSDCTRLGQLDPQNSGAAVQNTGGSPGTTGTSGILPESSSTTTATTALPSLPTAPVASVQTYSTGQDNAGFPTYDLFAGNCARFVPIFQFEWMGLMSAPTPATLPAGGLVQVEGSGQTSGNTTTLVSGPAAISLPAGLPYPQSNQAGVLVAGHVSLISYKCG